MKMKKLFLFALATAMMSFTGCQMEEQNAPVNPNEGGSTFELVAEILQTKTTLDAQSYEVEWEEGDVVYMVTSGAETPWATSVGFTYADGKFSTDETIANGSYTFNGLYAVAEQAQWHKGSGSTHKLEATQTQDCANPTAHIKLNDALVGTFTASVPTEAVQMTMSHLYTLMQVDITNNTGADIEVSTFEMTAAGADLAGIFNIDAFDTSVLSNYGDEIVSTVEVVVNGGTVKAGSSLPVYFVMAPLADHKDDITFKVTDSDGNTYTKTIKIEDGISFTAGTYNTTPYTISAADEVTPEPEGVVTATLTFDDKAKRTEYSTSIQVWEENGIKLTNAKESATTNVGDYANPARFYKNSTITIEAPGYITKIEFNSVTTSDKLGFLKELLPNASVNDNVVTEVYDGLFASVSYSLTTGQIQLNSITVTYSTEGYVAPTLESIEVSGDYKSKFTQGEDFSFGGVITATYSDESTKTIAATDCAFSGYNKDVVGNQRVTVTYEGETTTYDIEVVAAENGGDEGGEDESGWVSTSFADLEEGDQVVIVSTNGSSIYAMSNNNGTGSAPTAVEITYANDKLTKEPDANVIWYVGVDVDKRIFYSNTAKTNWMYCTNTNNGVRVGDNTNKTFVLDTSGYLKHVGTNRYLGVYNNDDWRCYNNTTGNIVGQTFQFFVNKGGAGSESPEPTPKPVELVMSDISCPVKTENSLTFTWTAVENAVGYQVYLDGADKGPVNALSYTAEGLEAGTSHTIAVKAVGNGTDYITSPTAKTCTASTEASSGGTTPEQPEQGGETQSTTVTINVQNYASTNSWVNGTQYKTLKLDDVITATVSGGSNTGKYYTSGYEWRIYQTESPSLTISAAEGKTIEKVKITYNVSNTGVLTRNSSNISSGTIVSVKATSVTFGVGNTGTKTNGQVKITAIEVVYNN